MKHQSSSNADAIKNTLNFDLPKGSVAKCKTNIDYELMEVYIRLYYIYEPAGLSNPFQPSR